MNLIPSLFLLLVLPISWLESESAVLAASTTITSSTFYCGQTPCKAPAHCCGDNNYGCCASSSSSSSSSYWYIFLTVGLVTVGAAVGVGIGIYFWRKRGGRLPYFRNT